MSKYYTHNPIATRGFSLNYIITMLILCKPFTNNFNKYPSFLSKINCFYLANNDQIENTKDRFEKVKPGSEDLVKACLAQDIELDLSGVTLNPLAEASSLMDDNN